MHLPGEKVVRCNRVRLHHVRASFQSVYCAVPLTSAGCRGVHLDEWAKPLTLNQAGCNQCMIGAIVPCNLLPIDVVAFKVEFNVLETDSRNIRGREGRPSEFV